MADAVAHSYYIPWYKRWWGKVLIAVLALVLLLVIYLGYSVVKHIRHAVRGDIYNPENGTWITLEKYQEGVRLVAEVMTGDDPWLGSEEPLVYIVSYESFGCPYCQEAQPEVNRLLQEYGSAIRFVVKDFPLEGLHPGVFEAHLAAGCANEQGKFWEYRDLLYERQTDFTEQDLKAWAADVGMNQAEFNVCFSEERYSGEIREDYAEGVEAQVVGTPSYFINNTLIPGSISFELWEQILAYIVNN